MGHWKKKSIIRAKKIEENFELEKTEGGIVLLPASDIVAIIPQYPKKGLKYSLGDVRNAIKTLRAVPAEFAPSAEELKRWEAMEEILAASAPETVPMESAQQSSSAKEESKENSPRPISAGVTLKNVIGGEELYQACKGPLGKEFVGKSVIVEGVIVEEEAVIGANVVLTASTASSLSCKYFRMACAKRKLAGNSSRPTRATFPL